MLAFGDTPVLFVVRDDSDKVQENYKCMYMLYKNSCYNDVIITSTFINFRKKLLLAFVSVHFIQELIITYHFNVNFGININLIST